jgi:hypothetical protein
MSLKREINSFQPALNAKRRFDEELPGGVVAPWLSQAAKMLLGASSVVAYSYINSDVGSKHVNEL